MEKAISSHKLSRTLAKSYHIRAITRRCSADQCWKLLLMRLLVIHVMAGSPVAQTVKL
jgi:hypothetical protein